MKQTLTRLLLLLAVAQLALPHFVFVVPDSASSAKVIISEDLKTAEEVDVSIIAGTKLTLRSADGAMSPLTMTKGDGAFRVALSGAGLRVIHGFTDLGFTQRGTSKPHLLLYYPKTIVGDPFDPKSVVGGKTPVEIVPAGKPGAVTLKLLAHGKPLPNGEITVILPGGEQKKLSTGASGETEPLAAKGRYGAWARFWEPGSGERDGKKYEELRHYATLVFDVPQATSANSFATLPQATSSFGAAESDGWLYVYGGHISPTHTYWKEAVSGRFHRLNVATRKWEELPAGPGLQGMNLAAFGGKIYRIGGMAPQNEKGKAADNQSTTDCARFDPAVGKWEALPPLPDPRSSHDVVVVGNRMIVIGGWNLHGAKQDWVDNLAVMDLSTKNPQWKTVPVSFRRRALIATAFHDRLYVIGGFDEKSRIVRDVSVFNPETSEWSDAPALPEGPGKAFAPAAVVLNGHLYVSVSDGTLLRLNEAGKVWESVGKSSPRVAHRLISSKDSVLVIGGANNGNNLDSVEAILPEKASVN